MGHFCKKKTPFVAIHITSRNAPAVTANIISVAEIVIVLLAAQWSAFFYLRKVFFGDLSSILRSPAKPVKCRGFYLNSSAFLTESSSEHKHLLHKLLVSKVADRPVGKFYRFTELILLRGERFITPIMFLIRDIC
jgi:hypothetical protein